MLLFPIFLMDLTRNATLSNDTIFLASSVGWGRKMSVRCIGAVLRAHTRTRVAVVEFQVSLYPISVSHFFPLYTRYMCEYIDLNSLNSANKFVKLHVILPQAKQYQRC